MNKKHWNTIYLDGTISDIIMKEMIDNSYMLIYKSLPTNTQTFLNQII